MKDKVFVDTNILVYSRDAGAGKKQQQAASVLEDLWVNRTGRISTQVCNEYYVTVTRKLKPGLSEERAFADVQALFAWDPLPINTDLLRDGRAWQMKYSLSWWDSLILASAHRLGCATVLSEDLTNGRDYGGVTVHNPFLD